MTEEISVELEVLRRILDEMRGEGLSVTSTIDILRRYQGGYLKNTGIPASQSFNAKFGKVLKRQEGYLGIQEVQSNSARTDDLGGETSCSVWSL